MRQKHTGYGHYCYFARSSKICRIPFFDSYFLAPERWCRRAFRYGIINGDGVSCFQNEKSLMPSRG